MCGIFGVLMGVGSKYNRKLLKDTIDQLFILSSSRGKDASGIAILNFNNGLSISKISASAHNWIRMKTYKQFIDDAIGYNNGNYIKGPLAIVGHTRLATNGVQSCQENNAPIVSGNIIGVHNGIIVNNDLLLKDFPSIKKKGMVDSEVIFSLLDLFDKKDISLTESLKNVFRIIEGSASIAALLIKYHIVILATNTGSIYYCKNEKSNIFMFASEPWMLERVIKKLRLKYIMGRCCISQLKSKEANIIRLKDIIEQKFSLDKIND